jgi:hypothetical protein
VLARGDAAELSGVGTCWDVVVERVVLGVAGMPNNGAGGFSERTASGRVPFSGEGAEVECSSEV